MPDCIFTVIHLLPISLLCLFYCLFWCRSLNHSNEIEGENSSLFFVLFLAQIGEIRRPSVFYVFVFFFLLALFLPAILFQVAVNISRRSEAANRQPGGLPGDESDASRFRWNAGAVAAGM